MSIQLQTPHTGGESKWKSRCGIDPEKIKNELGWCPETTFEVGIEKTIRWYLANEAWMKNVTSGENQKYYEEMYRNK